jgi:hypothetical protein
VVDDFSTARGVAIQAHHGNTGLRRNPRSILPAPLRRAREIGGNLNEAAKPAQTALPGTGWAARYAKVDPPTTVTNSEP